MTEKIKLKKKTVIAQLSQPIPTTPSITRDVVKIEGMHKLSYEVVSDRKVQLTKKRIAAYLALPKFEEERNVDDAWVQFLYDQMKQGLFNPLPVTIITALLGDQEYGINGQHTCWAASFMPDSYCLEVRYVQFRVKSMSQLQSLYGSIDRAKSRSDNHILRVLLSGSAATEDANKRLISRVGRGLLYWLYESQEERGRVSPEALAALVNNQYMELFRTVITQLGKDPDAKFMTRQSVIAAMCGSYAVVPTKAEDFWQPVASGLGLDRKTDARYALRDYLMNASLHASPGSHKRTVPTETMYRVCCQAWNKWRNGEDVRAMLRPTLSRVKLI